MPLFHSNALLAGWSVAVGSGSAMVPATFSASGLLSDLRRYGATYMNYVGKPLAYVLATPEQPDDADNPLRVAFGNEASDRDIAEFSRRFDCTVWDGFGSSEGAIIITREDGCPPGSLGRGFPGVSIYNSDTLAECPVARFDDDGALINPDEAIGELVNTTGAGLFAGYYNDKDATDARLAQRHVLVGRPGLPRRRRLDLLRRAQRGLVAGRRREHDDGAHRAHPAAAAGGQPGRGVRGTG